MKLRSYQDYAVKQALKALNKDDCSTIIAAPTGVGKSAIMAGLIKTIYTMWPSYPTKFLSLVHVKELIDQNSKALQKMYPEACIGIYSSGLGQKDLHFPITFAGIASIYKLAKDVGRIDIVLIDECHLIGTSSSGMYVSFLRALKLLNPKLRIIGLTATPYRVGLGILTDGEIFNDICCDMTGFDAFNWFIDEGYLCPLDPIKPAVTFDESGIRVSGGDYNQKDQDDKLNTKTKNEEVVEEIISNAHLYGKNHWLVFGVTIDHVEKLYEIFIEKGIKTTYVHSKLPEKERDARIEAYKRGEYQCMVNNGVLTTGFDFPALDLIAVVRLIRSPGLWVQILGRGARPDYAEGFDLESKEGRLQAIALSAKQYCLVLDFGGNTARLGPINDVIIPKKKGKGGGKAPIRLCGCGHYIHASLTVCKYCGKEYIRDLSSKVDKKASTQDIIAKVKQPPEPHEPMVVHMNVDSVVLKAPPKTNSSKPGSIKVCYNVGLTQFIAYLCFDHPQNNFAHKKSRAFWREHVAGTPYADLEPPTSNAEALSRGNELRQPLSIGVDIKSKFKEVVSRDFVNKVEISQAV